jgi:hypothetical protein
VAALVTVRLVTRGPAVAWTCGPCGAEQTAAPSGDTLTCDACFDAGYRGEPYIPLIVKMTAPKRTSEMRPILAVCMREMTVLTEDGEMFSVEELAGRLRERRPGERAGSISDTGEPLPPAIVTVDHGVDLLAWLDNSACADSPFWQWQVALTEMSAWRPEAKARKRSSVSLQPRPMRFGFASRSRGRRRQEGRARWYQMIDVHRFCELPDGWGAPDARELLRFGVSLREWCNANRVPVSSSGSGIGSRLLRDSRFGGGWRRKIPAATNARARTLLTGNHYQLLTVSSKRIEMAHKFDMRRAHHWAALTTGFPHPDTLDAHGWFRHMPHGEDDGPITMGSPRWETLARSTGLHIVRVFTPKIVAADPLELPQLRRAGRRWVALSSDELAYVRARGDGVRVGDMWASWSSPDLDDRLNAYSWWAQTALEAPDAEPWLKPALLSVYGLLAARARRYRSAWRWTSQSEGELGWHTPRGMLVGMELPAGREREPAHVNVVWRAMIERRVRMEALRFARSLRDRGMRPVSIYADAVFATGNVDPIIFPVPWRYEGVIHDLAFDGPQRYRAREETRLPGTPRERGQLTRAH